MRRTRAYRDKKLEMLLDTVAISKKLRSVNKDIEHQELIYEVKAKKEINQNMISGISDIKGVNMVNIVAESGENVG